jgi:2-methylcitrate dehydratase PrpD
VAENAVTLRLARFLVESRWGEVPQAVRHEAKRALLNFLGCALGGCRDEAIERALAAFSPFSGPPQATLIGRGERLDVLHAALVNAMSANILDFDDTHLRTVIHPSAPVAAALFSLAELWPASGERLLHAFVLGVEAECRIGNAVSPGHYERGWHISGTCGVFGAAAAAGKLLGLDAQRMAWALGLAATQSAGLVEMLGSMAKSFHLGAAARNGLAAALLAEKRFTASEHGIEAPQGFAHVLGQKPGLSAITDRLGETWELSQNAYKPYPCGVVLHPVIDGCIELCKRHAIAARDIERIALTVNPLAIARADRKSPRGSLEAKLSLQHGAAVALIHGAAGVKEFTDACVGEPVVAALRGRVELAGDPSMAKEAARVALHMKSGRALEADVPQALGSLQRPMSDSDLEAKFRNLAEAGAPGREARSTIDRVWSLDALADAASLLRLAVSRAE